MSDYTKVFDGVTKDNTTATVLGAEHDTEFDAISTAIGTKTDKVVSATSGNIAELDANGNLVDSGIDSADLDGLTSNAQDQLDALTPSAAVSGHARAWNAQLLDGTATTSLFDVASNVTVDTFETVGPTGSGATNIWAELDAVPSTARAIICNLYISITATTGAGYADAYAAVNGVSAVAGNGSQIGHSYIDADSGDVLAHMAQVIIPCDSSQIFQASWSTANLTSELVRLHYIGFIEGVV